MRITWEYSVRSKGTNTPSSLLPEHTSSLTESSTSLDEVINKYHIFSFWISFFDIDLSFISFSTYLDTDDFINIVPIVFPESLRSTIIWECDYSILRYLEKRCCCVKFSIDMERVKEKSLCERMDIECMYRGFTVPCWRKMREDIRHISGCSYLSLLGDTFHSTNWEVWDDNSHLVCVVVDESSYESILFDECIERGEVTDICHILMLYVSFYIMDEEVRSSVRKMSIIKFSFFELFWIFSGKLIDKMVESRMREECFHRRKR